MEELTKKEKQVFNFIKKNPNNYLTQKQISEKLNVSYVTIVKISRVLEISGKIKIKRVGQNKFIEIA